MDIDDMKSFPVLTREESKELNEFLKQNKRLAYTFFNRNRRIVAYSKIELDDAVQELLIGMWRAKVRFEPGKGAYSTYAFVWMKQRLIREAQSNPHSGVRVPINVHSDYQSIARLTRELGRRPTDEDFAKHYQWAPGHADMIRKKMSVYRLPPVLLDAPVKHDSDTSVLDLFITEQGKLAPQEAALDTAIDDQNLTALLNRSGLTGRERHVLNLRFGLGTGGQERTLEEVGHAIGLTRERARQIEVIALKKLREKAAALSLGSVPASALSKPENPPPKVIDRKAERLLRQILKRRNTWVDEDELCDTLSCQINGGPVDHNLIAALLENRVRLGRILKTVWHWSTRAVTMYRTRSDG